MRLPLTYAVGEHDAQAIVKVRRLWNAPPQSRPHIWAMKQHKRKKRQETTMAMQKNARPSSWVLKP
jgi:hypothetical protein